MGFSSFFHNRAEKLLQHESNIAHNDSGNRLPDGPLPDFSIPREGFMLGFDKLPGPCPRCGGELKKHWATYFIQTRNRGVPADDFITGNDMGWFCASCPAVVINKNKLEELRMVYAARPDWEVDSEIEVIGIVNKDAIPEEKRCLPIGNKNNPVPLVEFTNTDKKTKTGCPGGDRVAPRREKRPGGYRGLGTEKNPAVVRVRTEKRSGEILRFCTERGWQVIVGIEPDRTEDISDVEKLINPPPPFQAPSAAKPHPGPYPGTARNAPCPCGSGKKYKKCCLGKE